MSGISSVNIRPGVNILSVLPHLNYKAWFALAEFVDNSIQSSIDNRKGLNAVTDGKFKLRIDIDFLQAESRIVVRDNAAGIATSDYQRAFRPAEIPPNASGLSEFGMGMKSAASWFAPTWSVRSSALGENIERAVYFDIDKIVHDSIEELNVISTPVANYKHYTEIHLEKIRRFPKGRTIGKIKEHLSSIYRIFIRSGQLELYVDEELLTYEEPKILTAPHFKDFDGPEVEWKCDIDFDLGDGKSVKGFVAIREKANTRLAGLAIFRRDRLILGSADESYRPDDIFGASTSFAYQRLFGEIHLKGFFVSHTKDGIKWEENEDEFLKKLRKLLASEDLPMLQQVRNYSTKRDARNNRHTAGIALQGTAQQFENKNLSVQDFVATETVPFQPGSSEPVSSPPPALSTADQEVVTFDFSFRDQPWIVKIELSYSESEREWLSIQNRPSIADPDPRQIEIRLAMLHPFMAQYPNLGADGLSAVLGIAASMALSEVIAAELAKSNPAVIRQYSSEILKKLLSRPIRDE
jgi:hypothetical protein